MAKMIRCLGFLLWFCGLIPLHAQEQPPLQSPLLAFNTVQRDEIILYDVTTQAYRRLPMGTGAHQVWDFSPDGCRLLFTTETTGYARLFSMALDGTDRREMVTYSDLSPERWGVWEPDWSPNPDDPRIAFTFLREQFRNGELELQSHIAYVLPDDPTPQFYSVTGREFTPIWSPNGAYLAYVSYGERVAGVNALSTAIPTADPLPGQTPTPPILVNEADLWVVQADAGLKYFLTDFNVGSVSAPRWSWDSELISFVYSPSPNNDMIWMIANRPRAIATPLSYQWTLALDHHWLPDNTAIIASMRDYRDIAENRLWQIPLVNNQTDAGAIFYQPDVAISYADFPRFSPDGRYLAVRTAYEVMLIDLSTQNSQLLASVVFGNTQPVWSPVGFVGEARCR